MNKIFLLAALLLGGATFVACDDDEKKTLKVEEQTATDLDYQAANAKSWLNYAEIVSGLLKKDTEDLHNAWATSHKGGASYASLFKAHAANSAYPSAQSAVEQIVKGCITIANEVGNAKLGEPYNDYLAGNKQKALYGVESWYSWHSKDDFRNNISSIKNALYGNLKGTPVQDLNYHSILAWVGYASPKKNRELMMKVHQAMNNADQKIEAIPTPFRDNIASAETKAAIEACLALEEVLDKELLPFLNNNADEAYYDKIVTTYVDQVVVPTYKDLQTRATALHTAVQALKAAPSNATFKAASEAWLSAREPWEKSEAFLFGPVADLGLDPNMDSWPLDQAAIVNILTSGKFDALQWSGEYDEEDKKIEAAQSVRGFHTLEYLLFKNGKPRTVK